MSPPVAILLFAAGSSSRMGGRDKLTRTVDGVPLLRRVASRAVGTGLPVLALLPPDRPERAAALDGLALRRVPVPDAALGMAQSIRAGLGALPPDTPGALMLMADMPDITGGDLRRLADRFIELGGETVVRAATRDGTPGSPNVVPRALFPALMRLSGDTGGRDVLRTVPQDHVALDGRRAVTDLDTPADWAAWRAARDQS